MNHAVFPAVSFLETLPELKNLRARPGPKKTD
jgi:hypothetical protein